jgi:hypothetical protein
MTLESMASTELGRQTILNNPNVVRVIQETARGPLHNFDRLLKVILSCISFNDSRARAFELFGEIICDVRYAWFEDNDVSENPFCRFIKGVVLNISFLGKNNSPWPSYGRKSFTAVL